MALLPKLLIIIIEDRTSDVDGIKYFIEMLLDNILTPSASPYVTFIAFIICFDNCSKQEPFISF